jgi:hypothetical protein
MSGFGVRGEGQSRSPFELILVSYRSCKLVAGVRYELYSNYRLQIQAVAASVDPAD